MTNYQDLINRLEAGYTKPLSTPPEFAEAAAAIRELLEHRDDLLAALELGLEYWRHRQQRYKNRSPAWVEAASAAIASVKGGA